MSNTRRGNKKLIAGFFLSLLVVQNFFPMVAWALTSGPAQPEMQKFEPAGASDMVDLFSGDFKYNIPLMDVGGYPVNLSYHSGSGMEDEASWVGMNWSLNPGAMNRSMRGIPDDFTGKDGGIDNPADKIRYITHRKPLQRIGGKVTLKPTFFGFEIGSPSLSLGVYRDNYWGIGAEVGASLSFNVASNGNTSLTAGLDVGSDTRMGVNVKPSLTLTEHFEEGKEINGASLAGAFEYNTRTGLKNIGLRQSFSLAPAVAQIAGTGSFDAAAYTKYFGQTYIPSLNTNKAQESWSVSLDGGIEAFGGYLGIGGEGYIVKESVLDKHVDAPAYGYLNYDQGRNNLNAALDFNREKDGVYFEGTPSLPIPVATEDYFEAVSQAGSQQFRPFYSGNYTVFDRKFISTDKTLGLGLTLGWGNLVQGGGRINLQSNLASTNKWVKQNMYLTGVAELPAADPGKPLIEANYFKKTGEKAAADPAYYTLIGKDVTERAAINNRTIFQNASQGAAAYPVFQSAGDRRGGSTIKRDRRDIRTSTLTCLTAAQAEKHGLDKKINGTINRVDGLTTLDPLKIVHKAHHISEMTVTDEEGKRMVYGIPVYNVDQEEVTFSVDKPDPAENARKTGLISYVPGVNTNGEENNKGRSNLYEKKVIPPYATSYLLTGILSPDYVDRKGDGITDDDLGTAVKFSYDRLTDAYQWRAPYEQNKANYNEGFLSDDKDNMASYVYGQKEIWYVKTISSKTMVAKFFTSNREDGLGVLGENGGANTGVKLQKLDSIRLFSKADLLKNGVNAVPIKVVHFEYDYSLYPGVPNNSGIRVPDPNGADPETAPNLNANKGKLTLKKVYFTFGANSRGKSNPYVFDYDMARIRGGGSEAPAGQDPKEAEDQYAPRQVDRWGSYKQSFYNPQFNGLPALNNSEYPYSQQVTDYGQYDERLLADKFASKWQLKTITTPVGGVISVEYEADDYAYVQDRKAMVMCPLTGVGQNGRNTGMIKANKLYVKVPVSVPDVSSFIRTYLDGPYGQTLKNIFYKIFIDVDNRGHNEFVYGYAEIDPNGNFDKVDDHTYGIPVKYVDNYNPVSKATWQMIKTDLPQYAYENYDNSNETSFGQNVKAAVVSIIQAFVNLRELFQPFEKTASNNRYADKVDLTRSMIRLDYPVGLRNGGMSSGTVGKYTWGKLGGGSRVRKVEISDNWQTISGNSSAKESVYGQLYDYTLQDDKGNPVMSSGVAAYEPQIGNEENPFHEPVNYTEKVQWGQDRYHHIVKPFGESYFPSPSVGYSRVKVTPYGTNKYTTGSDPTVYASTGYTVSEFYTARDFPTQVDYLPLQQETYEKNLVLALFASNYVNRVTASQGFKVVLNDMHGREKAVKVYDKGNSLIASTEYFYHVVDNKAAQQQLDNTVLAMDADGNIPAGGMLLGTDAELVTDVRESTASSSGSSAGLYGGGFWAIFAPLAFFAANMNKTSKFTSFNSISSVKVIHQYGIISEVRTMKNGSSITARNLLWDARTGNVLLTQSQNEFNDYTYALQYPAYMAYEGMGTAYSNSGTLFAGFFTGANGLIGFPTNPANPTPGNPANLFPGDELVKVDNPDIHGWVIRSGDNSLRFIDKLGNFISTSGNFLLLRSGKRNLLNASAGTVISMTNPLVQTNGRYQLQVGVDKKVLDAKAVKYKDEWGMPVPMNYVPVNYEDTATDCIGKLFKAALAKVLDRAPGSVRRGLFTRQSDNLTAGYFLSPCTEMGVKCDDCRKSGKFLNGQTASDFPFYQNTERMELIGGFRPSYHYMLDPGNTAQVGNYQIVFDEVDPSFHTLANSSMSEQNMLLELDDSYVTSSNPSMTVQKYCMVKESTQHYALLRANAITPPANPDDWPITAECGQNQYVQYTKMIRFHVIGITKTKYVCQDPLDQPINPYYQDVKGNWKPYTNYVYQVNRVQTPGLPGQLGGTNIRTSGYYAEFSPFWTPVGGSWQMNAPAPVGYESIPSDPRWVWANKPVYYDEKSNEIENVDALNRYGAALFGYRQSVATAVAANARHNEIAFDGFEDYNFDLEALQGENCSPKRHLDLGVTAGDSRLVTAPIHSGNYSLHLQGGSINVTKALGNNEPNLHILDFDPTGRYLLKGNELAAGFAPISEEEYLLSVWVYEKNPQGDPHPNVIHNLQVSLNGIPKDLSMTTVPVVEGWKKLDLVFSQGSVFDMVLTSTGDIYIDDLRIHPQKGEMKSFVYDDRTMRLMAQLDENNFATIYEYDQEGTPVRVKKETERGVMTIKENRQSYRKNQ